MDRKRANSFRNLLLVMTGVVVAGILLARSYYGRLNQTSDPRVVEARLYYKDYDQLAGSGDFPAIFALLDSIESVYRKVPHYKGSFELGVLENNRAASYLTLGLFKDSIPLYRNPFPELTQDSLVERAKAHVQQAISIYTQWDADYSGLSEEQIREKISPFFSPEQLLRRR